MMSITKGLANKGEAFCYGYIKVDGVSSVFCFIWGWEEPAWGLPFQFHGVFFVMISMKGP